MEVDTRDVKYCGKGSLDRVCGEDESECIRIKKMEK
jgi:hypothetical protein